MSLDQIGQVTLNHCGSLLMAKKNEPSSLVNVHREGFSRMWVVGLKSKDILAAPDLVIENHFLANHFPEILQVNVQDSKIPSAQTLVDSYKKFLPSQIL